MKAFLAAVLLIASAASAAAETTPVDLVDETTRVNLARLSPDGARALAVLGDGKTLTSWDTASGAVLFTRNAERGWISDVILGADGARLFAMFNFQLTVFDAATGATISACDLPALGSLHDVSGDGTKALLRFSGNGHAGFKLALFDIAACKEVAVVYDGPLPTGYNAMLSPDGTLVAFDTAEADLPVTHFVHLDGSPAFPDRPGVIAFGAKSMKGGGQNKAAGAPIDFAAGRVVAIEAPVTGKYLPLSVFDLTSGTTLATYQGHVYEDDIDGGRFGGLGYSINFSVLSPDARLVASDGGGGAAIWEAATGKAVVSNLSQAPLFAARAPRAAAIVRGKGQEWEDNEARLFDTATGAVLASFAAMRIDALSDDGTVVLTRPKSLDGLRVYVVR